MREGPIWGPVPNHNPVESAFGHLLDAADVGLWGKNAGEAAASQAKQANSREPTTSQGHANQPVGLGHAGVVADELEPATIHGFGFGVGEEVQIGHE